jgi:hypothetical protein
MYCLHTESNTTQTNRMIFETFGMNCMTPYVTSASSFSLIIELGSSNEMYVRLKNAGCNGLVSRWRSTLYLTLDTKSRRQSPFLSKLAKRSNPEDKVYRCENGRRVEHDNGMKAAERTKKKLYTLQFTFWYNCSLSVVTAVKQVLHTSSPPAVMATQTCNWEVTGLNPGYADR